VGVGACFIVMTFGPFPKAESAEPPTFATQNNRW
jgi:hypothetical protein